MVYVVDPDLKRPEILPVPPGMLTAELSKVTDDPEIVAAVELVGGLEPARTIVLKLLESGKNIVTANKALLAEHGPELFDKARHCHHRCLPARSSNRHSLSHCSALHLSG